MSGQVNALAVSGSNLFVGGEFVTAGSVGSPGIAMWDGAAWSAVGFGVDGSSPYVNALATSGSNLYAGGTFTYPANKLARWDGAAWSALGAGITAGTVYALAASGDDVYAGFVTAVAGLSTGHVSKWHEGSWFDLGAQTGGGTSAGAYVYSLKVVGNELFAGGDFSIAGGVPANSVAKWDGTAWSAIGAGMNGAVRVLALSGEDLHAVGEFSTAGKSVSVYWAKLNLALRANAISVSLDGGDFTARYQGRPGVAYTMEQSPAAVANWQKLANLTAPTNDIGWGVGVFELRAQVLFPGQRFYRAVYPAY
jgi:hypothetical protein